MLGLTDTVNLRNMGERVCAGTVGVRVRAKCGGGKVLVLALVLAGVTHEGILWVVRCGMVTVEVEVDLPGKLPLS